MKNIITNPEILQNVAKVNRVALIYHLRIGDKAAYNNWYSKSSDLLESMDGSRLFNISVDPVPREGMFVNEIIIDEYPSAEVALKFVGSTQAELIEKCQEVTILAIQPEPHVKFRIVRAIAFLMHFLRVFKIAELQQPIGKQTTPLYGLTRNKWQLQENRTWIVLFSFTT